MPIRIRHRSKYSANFKPYRSMRAHPGHILPPSEQQCDELKLEEFDKEFEEFVTEQKKIKKKRKKRANNQSDQQVGSGSETLDSKLVKLTLNRTN